MFAKVIILGFLAIGVHCRYVVQSSSYVVDPSIGDENVEVSPEQYSEPEHLNSRVRRQLHGVINSNPDGSSKILGTMPLVGNDQNRLSAIGGIGGAKLGGGVGSVSGGAALDNVNGHGLSLTGNHFPDFGKPLTGAGKLNLLHKDHHDHSANTFTTSTMPANPVIPNFNTHGGGLEYKFNKKIGGSLSAAHSGLFKKTDLSAMGNLNLFRSPSSSLDLNAGFTRSPFILNKSWQKSGGLTFSKHF